MAIRYLDAPEKEVYQNWVAEQSKGDADGWVYWPDTPPKPNVTVECRREEEDGTYEVTPKEMSLNWNTTGVYWRPLK